MPFQRDRDRDQERERERTGGPLATVLIAQLWLDRSNLPPALGVEDRLYLPAASARDFDRTLYAGGNASLPFSHVRGPSLPHHSGADDLRLLTKHMRNEAPPAYASGGVTGVSMTYPQNSTYSPD